jgi:hypothetical protein
MIAFERGREKERDEKMDGDGEEKTCRSSFLSSLSTHGQRQEVKHLRAVPPGIRIAILALAFIVKPIHLRDLAGLVVAAE